MPVSPASLLDIGLEVCRCSVLHEWISADKIHLIPPTEWGESRCVLGEGKNTIHISCVRGEQTLLAAMHELGHIACHTVELANAEFRPGGEGLRLEAEAWLWALEHFPLPLTEAGRELIAHSLTTYRTNAPETGLLGQESDEWDMLMCVTGLYDNTDDVRLQFNWGE